MNLKRRNFRVRQPIVQVMPCAMPTCISLEWNYAFGEWSGEFHWRCNYKEPQYFLMLSSYQTVASINLLDLKDKLVISFACYPFPMPFKPLCFHDRN